MSAAGLPDDRNAVIMETGYFFGRKKSNILFQKISQSLLFTAWKLRSGDFAGDGVVVVGSLGRVQARAIS